MNIDTVMDVPALCAVIKEKYDLFSTRKVLYDRWYQCFLENFYYSKEKGSGRQREKSACRGWLCNVYFVPACGYRCIYVLK